MSLATIAEYSSRLTGQDRSAGGQWELDRRTDDLVSIITVCFNAEATIERTIESVASQTYPAIEYIVIDGGSTDDTLSRIQGRQAIISRWLSEPDAGISDAFNKGIAMASGNYVMLVNADDWLDPEHVAIGVAALRRSGCSYVFGDLILHAQDGSVAHILVGEPSYQKRIRHVMPFINHPTVICERNAFQRFGLFDTSLQLAMDYEWFLRIHRAGAVGEYVSGLKSHMSLQGASDRQFPKALAEVRDVSIRYGYPRFLAWGRYAARRLKGSVRMLVESWMPRTIYEYLRGRVNRNFRGKN